MQGRYSALAILALGIGLGGGVAMERLYFSAPKGGADGPAMKAEVDGNDWTATSVTTVELSNSFNITASAADGSSIILSIPKDATAGSTNTISLTYSARFNSDASTPLLGTTGEIKVDDIDATSVSGEFEFDATDGTTTVEVKNGEFSAEVNG